MVDFSLKRTIQEFTSRTFECLTLISPSLQYLSAISKHGRQTETCASCSYKKGTQPKTATLRKPSESAQPIPPSKKMVAEWPSLVVRPT